MSSKSGVKVAFLFWLTAEEKYCRMGVTAMDWIFLILGGIVLMEILSLFSTHIGYQKRREAYEKIANERLNEMQNENRALKREITEIQAYAADIAHQVNGRTRMLEDGLNTVLEYNQKMRELFYDLKDRILLLSDLTADDTDPNELKQKLNLLVECVLQDDEKIQQYEGICKADRAARGNPIPIKPIEYSVDIGGVDGD